MGMRWKRGARVRSVQRSGKFIWLGIVCIGLMSGSNIARLTGQALTEQMVCGLVSPVCGLTAYAGLEDRGSFWRYLLREILTVPLPLISYAEREQAQETAVNDPVYEKYLSSEILYHGGGPLVLDGVNQLGGSGATSQNDGTGGQEMPGQNDGTGGGRSPGQNDSTGGGEVPGQNDGTGGNDGTTGGEIPDQNDSTGEGKITGQNGSISGEENTPTTTIPTVSSRLPTQLTGRQFSLNQLTDFNYLVDQLYFVHSSTTVYPDQLKAAELLQKNLTIEKNGAVPQILIHHTHGTEDFDDSVEGAGMTILEVGDYLTELLEGYGYNVIHDRSVYPYDTAYSEANARVRKILAENPTIELVIDLHRDATASRKRYVVDLNGLAAAPLMFFNGMCQTADGPIDYLSNPYLEDNLALSLQMKLLAEAYYPGLTRPNFLKAYQYNQHLHPRYTLVEAGFDTNTFEEVCRSMEPLAKILDAVLTDPEAVPLVGST